MKGVVYVFPGTFSPPTYGHLEVVKRAAGICSELVIICSKNPDKAPWFTPEECVGLWSSYELPNNVRVTTLPEFVKERNDPSKIVMVRGIRNENDLAHENSVVLLNKRDYGISNYLYIITDPDFENVSSSRARKLANELDRETLSVIVSPKVVGALMAKVLKRGGR